MCLGALGFCFARRVRVLGIYLVEHRLPALTGEEKRFFNGGVRAMTASSPMQLLSCFWGVERGGTNGA